MQRATTKAREEFIETLLSHLPEKITPEPVARIERIAQYLQNQRFENMNTQYWEPLNEANHILEGAASKLEAEYKPKEWSWFYDGRPFAQRLMRYGATLGRIAENQCNGYQDWQGNWDQKAADREERKEERIREKVIKLCAEFNCKPVFQGDPRGNTLKIAVPDGYTNDWGREGICVPTS